MCGVEAEECIRSGHSGEDHGQMAHWSRERSEQVSHLGPPGFGSCKQLRADEETESYFDESIQM